MVLSVHSACADDSLGTTTLLDITPLIARRQQTSEERPDEKATLTRMV